MASTDLPALSVSLGSRYEADGPARMVEQAQAAHRAGMASLTIGDHHNMTVSYVQNTPMLGRLLAEWPDRPAGCLFLVPLWSPLLMAEQIGTLAAIHHSVAPGKPFIVQTGIGYGEEQFDNLGRDMRRRGRDIDAAIPVVKALLAGETVTDEYFGLKDAVVGLTTGGPFEWWIGGTADAAIDRAARLGDVWYASPGLDDDTIVAGAERYRDAGGTRVALRRDAVLDVDSETAMQVGTQLIADGYRGLPIERLLVGSPAQVAQRCGDIGSLGVDEIVVRCASSDQSQALRTLDALAAVQ